MNEQQREDEENQKAIDKYLDEGGEVTVFPAGERSDPEVLVSPWNKRKAQPKK